MTVASVGMLFGNLAGIAIAVAILLIVPGNEDIWIGGLLGFGLSLVGGFLGRTAYQS